MICFPPTTVNPVIRITGAPQGPTTNTTVDLTAECIEGYHPVTFEWVDVANESVILGREAKFTVKVSGKVTYCCTAKNAFGKGTASTVVEGKYIEFLYGLANYYISGSIYSASSYDLAVADILLVLCIVPCIVESFEDCMVTVT